MGGIAHDESVSFKALIYHPRDRSFCVVISPLRTTKALLSTAPLRVLLSECAHQFLLGTHTRNKSEHHVSSSSRSNHTKLHRSAPLIRFNGILFVFQVCPFPGETPSQRYRNSVTSCYTTPFNASLTKQTEEIRGQ